MSSSDEVIEILNQIENNNTDKGANNSIIKEYIIIDIGSIFLALQIEYLKEVFDLANKNLIVPIPGTPDYILGIISVRGEIIPVVSLPAILGVQCMDDNYSKMLILEEKIKIAIPFHDIIDLKTLSIDTVREVKNASVESSERFISQEFEYNEKVIGIVDLLKLFTSEYCM